MAKQTASVQELEGKKSRAIKGEGSLKPRRGKDGRLLGYQAVVTVGYDPTTGRQIRRSVTASTMKEGQALLQALRQQAAHNRGEARKALTVGAFLDEWLGYFSTLGRAQNTVSSYADAIRLKLKPQVGRVKLDRLTPGEVQRMLGRLASEGVTPAGQQYALKVLKMALKQAVIWGHIPNSPAANIKAPPSAKKDAQPFTVLEAQQLVTFLSRPDVQAERLYPALLVSALTGMRRGEVLGLRWQDVDFRHEELKLRQQVKEVRRAPLQPGKMHAGKPVTCSVVAELGDLKTEAAERTIPLQPDLVAALKAWRDQQQQERAAHGARWQDTGLVFTNPDGSMTMPRYYSEVFKRLARAAGHERMRLHDLRHTNATLLVMSGAAPKLVQMLLGHTSFSFTADRYVHPHRQQLREAALNLGDLFKTGEDTRQTALN